MRALAILAASGFVLLGAPPAQSAGEAYAWSISESSTDPFVHTGTPLPELGLFNVYLWYVCNGSDGVAAAEFDIVVSEGFFLVSVITMLTGVFNLGILPTVELAIGGCPTPPTLVASITLFDLGLGGNACLGPSTTNGLNVSVDCGFPQPTAYPNGFFGYASDGSAPCRSGDCPNPNTSAPPTEFYPWSRIKGMYR